KGTPRMATGAAVIRGAARAAPGSPAVVPEKSAGGGAAVMNSSTHMVLLHTLGPEFGMGSLPSDGHGRQPRRLPTRVFPHSLLRSSPTYGFARKELCCGGTKSRAR